MKLSKTEQARYRLMSCAHFIFWNKILIFFLISSCSLTDHKNQRIPASDNSLALVDQVQEVISKLNSKILSEKKVLNENEEYFDMVAYLGPHITSTYFLSLYWTGDLPKNSYYADKLEQHLKLLRSIQNENGGWYRVLDSNLPDSSDPSATLTHYWLFKASGESANSPLMVKAQNYLRSQGGYKKIDVLTKFLLSLFGNFSWDDFPAIPYLVFNRKLPINDESFGAWVAPNLLPMSILRNLKATRLIGDHLLLDEFFDRPIMFEKSSHFKIKNKDRKMIYKFISEQRPKGSWGGYIFASIFGRMILHLSLESKNMFSDSDRKIMLEKKKLAENVINKYFFDVGSSNFWGATQDGHVWDTALLSLGLLESGHPIGHINKSLIHLEKMQSPNGGFPFGYDFENYPDVDDTAIILLALAHDSKLFKKSIERGLDFILKMQNDDGGFAAFSRNNNGNFILTFLTRKITDSVDLYDESSPDVTGHVLEAIGKFRKNGPYMLNTIDRTIQYLRKSQEKDGSFFGRWGINYIYSTGAVLSGLKSSGMLGSDPMVRKSISWLKSVQNKDGGFGESTLSYSRPELKGIGKSTTTQTAFALIGLLSYLPPNDPSIERGIAYLLNEFDYEKNIFHETSITGTGHPNVCYMVYPVYPLAFPLLALSRYLNAYSNVNGP